MMALRTTAPALSDAFVQQTLAENQEVIAAHLRPALTTMQLPHYEMGRWGANALLGDEPAAAGCTRLHCPLVPRQSVARVVR